MISLYEIEFFLKEKMQMHVEQYNLLVFKFNIQ